MLEILGWKHGAKLTIDRVTYELDEDNWEIPEALAEKPRKLTNPLLKPVP